MMFFTKVTKEQLIEAKQNANDCYEDYNDAIAIDINLSPLTSDPAIYMESTINIQEKQDSLFKADRKYNNLWRKYKRQNKL